ncbi:uncharacterized protein LOC119952433 isoform X2 [Scyliorhinus canicula]|uniref:uncharacterized protein LOC119952433 isoform X2 n=1 Tax=Scyliorhinus canicula TaxID=7830 RepID=UPI0018F73038|nr:uncharacterized protein LOC119952433 isoform X2 [Scyliorhinus canicula]
MTIFSIGHLPLLWLAIIGLSSVSTVGTSCLKCEKEIHSTLQLIDHQIQTYPRASHHVAQLTYINAFLQGKKMPPVSQDMLFAENIHEGLSNFTELSENVLSSIRNEIHNFLRNNFKNKKTTTFTAVVRRYAQLTQTSATPVRLVHCGTCQTRDVACRSETNHRTKRGILFTVGKIKFDMLAQSSKIAMPRTVLYSIPAVIAIVGFLCFLTFYCDVPHR